MYEWAANEFRQATPNQICDHVSTCEIRKTPLLFNQDSMISIPPNSNFLVPDLQASKVNDVEKILQYNILDRPFHWL